MPEEVVRLIIESSARGKGAQEGKKGLDKLAKAAKFAVGAFAALKAAQGAVEFVKFGAQVKATEQRFVAFSGGTDRATKFLETFRASTDYTIDRMSAMAGASKMLQMRLVSNADEMGVMAAIAVKLGNQMQGANERVADFSALLANQSIPRLDNFGISSARVRARIEELQKATADMSREEAFKIAVLEEGRKSLDILGDTSESAATKIAKIEAAALDAKAGLAELLIEAAAGAVSGGDIDEFTKRLRGLPETLEQTVFIGRYAMEWMHNWKYSLFSATKATELTNAAMKDSIPNLEAFAESQQQVLNITEDSGAVAQQYDLVMRGLNLTAVNSGKRFEQYSWALLETEKAQDAASWAAVEHREKLVLLRAEALRAREAFFDMKTSFTSFVADTKQAAEQYAEDREAIELKHQENIATIAKKGQATRIWVDAKAGEEKLADLRWRLDQALLQETEFSDKTRESTRRAKEHQIETLQTQVTTQEKLLNDHYNNRLWRAGQNTDDLLAEADRQYQGELAGLEENRKQQEEAQRQSLGRMVLQHFEAWATMKGIVGEQFLEMRTAIAEEYGLITSEGARAAREHVTVWNKAITAFGGDMKRAMAWWDDIEAKRERYKQGLLNMPKQVDIRIRTIHETIRKESPGATIPEFERQQGGWAYGSTLVGEAGPEMVFFPRQSYVMSAPDTRRIVHQNFGQNTYNVYDADAAVMLRERERVQRRRVFERLM